MIKQVINILCLVAAVSFLLLRHSTASAQNVQLSLDPRKGTVEDVFELKVIVSGRFQTEVNPPTFSSANRNFSISSTGTTTQHQFVNGVQHSQVVFSYQLQPASTLTPGDYDLPPGQMAIDGKAVRLDLPQITILADAGEQQGRRRSAAGVDFVQTVDNLAPYVGEQISYRAEVAADASFMGGTLEDIEFKGFWREQLPADEKQTRRAGNLTIRSFLEVLIPKKEGPVQIPPRLLTAKLRAMQPQRRQSAGGMFSDPFFADNFFDSWSLLNQDRAVTKRLTAPPLTINVRPLPPPPISQSGYVPVGSVKITTSVDKKKVAQGESLTMKIILSGDGNLRPLELPEQPAEEADSFKRYDDKPDLKTGFDNGVVSFTKTFNVAYVPLRAGELPLPTFRFLTFNPQTEKYEILETPARTITVLPSTQEQQLQGALTNRPTQTADEKIEEKKKDITIVAEDLLPQHVGAASLAPRKHISRSLLLAVLIIAPFCALLVWRRFERQRRLLEDPALLLEQRACSKAFLALTGLRGGLGESPTDVAEKLRQAVHIYLAERLRQNVQSFTPRESASLVQKRTGSEALARSFAAFFERIDRLLYSGSSMSATDWENQIRECEKLISSLEEALAKQRR